MKYIVGINELNSLELKREIREFCEEHLVDLLEGDYQLRVDYEKSDYHSNNIFGRAFGKDLLGVRFSLKASRNNTLTFSWDEVCDRYIPVFELLSRNYDIVKVNIDRIGWYSHNIKSYTKNLVELIKSDLGDIQSITFYIKENKSKN